MKQSFFSYLYLRLFCCLFLANWTSTQAQNTVFNCDSDANPALSFSYQAGTCATFSIQCAALSGSTYIHSWQLFSGLLPGGQSQVFTGFPICLPVPSPGIYTIKHTVLFPNGKTNSNECDFDFKVKVANPPVITYIPDVDPNTPIKYEINKDLPVGSIKGLNSVSLAGAATYSIPVALPSGTKGVEPSLSFEYSSQNSIGLMGFGWNMNAISSITRVSKDHYHDGYPSAPTLDALDGFALDGNRLILLSGEYGQPNSVYGTKNETFSRITLKQNKLSIYFVVETKSGMTLEYGNSLDARLWNAQQETVIWQLNRSQDAFGNYVEYHYTLFNDGMVLSEILYTGNEAAGLKPYNRVQFEYGYRADENSGYIAGVKVLAGALLKKVTINAEGQLFRRYEFAYAYDKIHTYLRELQVFDGNGIALNPTVFQYGVDTALPNFETYNININSSGGVFKGSGDFNGDGFSDALEVDDSKGTFIALTKDNVGNAFTPHTMVNYNTPNSTSAQVVYDTNSGQADQINFLAQDFDGDGFDDVPIAEFRTEKIFTNPDREWQAYYVTYLAGINIYTSQGNGDFNAPIHYPIKSSSPFSFNKDKRFIITGDFDGDSRSDYITILSDYTDFKTMIHFPALNSLNNDLPLKNPATFGGSLAGFANELASASLAQSVDFDGDGKTEILLYRDGNVRVFEIVKVLQQYEVRHVSTFGVNFQDRILDDLRTGDFNGDGKTDILLGLNKLNEDKTLKHYGSLTILAVSHFKSKTPRSKMIKISHIKSKPFDGSHNIIISFGDRI